MIKNKKKKFIFIGVIVLIIGIPVALLSDTVLQKFQSLNVKKYERLIKKMENGKEVEEEWKSLKYRQKLIGDLYWITLRKRPAITAYEKYMEWFIEDWKSKEFVEIKYEVGMMYLELAKEYAENRMKNRKRGACHLWELSEWYEDQQMKTIKRAQRVLSTRDLEHKTKNCQRSPTGKWN